MLSARAIAVQGIGFGARLTAVQGFDDFDDSPGHIVSMEFSHPALWWKRKPKALKKEEAAVLMRKAAKVIAKKAVEHAEEPEPVAQRIAEVRQAVSPLLAEMPGFDWRVVYEAAYQRALTLAIAAELAAQEARAAIEKAKRRDEQEIALLILMSN